MHTPLTRAWVDIDLGALRRNGAALAARAPAILPMLKADAYGLGAVPVARALESLSPWGFGVATIDEGLELRAAGIERPIIVFTPAQREELAELRRARLVPVLARADRIAEWAAVGGGPWHLPIDTGMSRTGVRWNEVELLRAALAATPPEGAFTHFHSAERGDGSRERQERRFEEALACLPSRPPVLHCENSAALVRCGDRSRWDLARPGVFLYGVDTGPGAALEPEPVVHLRARVVDLRTIERGETVSYDATWRAPDRRRIATIGAGYADGVRRALGNHATALLRGQEVPIVGVVTMDMTMLDVTDVECQLGDVATVVGRDGDALLTAGDVARAAELSPYELLTGLRSRVARVYRDER